MSNISFSHGVFKRLILQTRKNQGLFGKGLKHCVQRKECWEPVFSPYPAMFSPVSKTNFIIRFSYNLSSVNALNSEKFKILSFGIDLEITSSSFACFMSEIPNSKKLQTTTEIWLLQVFKIQCAKKTLWKKVKLLILFSNSFFSPKVFK